MEKTILNPDVGEESSRSACKSIHGTSLRPNLDRPVVLPDLKNFWNTPVSIEKNTHAKPSAWVGRVAVEFPLARTESARAFFGFVCTACLSRCRVFGAVHTGDVPSCTFLSTTRQSSSRRCISFRDK